MPQNTLLEENQGELDKIQDPTIRFLLKVILIETQRANNKADSNSSMLTRILLVLMTTLASGLTGLLLLITG